MLQRLRRDRSADASCRKSSPSRASLIASERRSRRSEARVEGTLIGFEPVTSPSILPPGRLRRLTTLVGKLIVVSPFPLQPCQLPLQGCRQGFLPRLAVQVVVIRLLRVLTLRHGGHPRANWPVEYAVLGPRLQPSKGAFVSTTSSLDHAEVLTYRDVDHYFAFDNRNLFHDR
jgi:hypothetical protein